MHHKQVLGSGIYRAAQQLGGTQEAPCSRRLHELQRLAEHLEM